MWQRSVCNGGRGKPATFASMENMNPGAFVLFKIVGKGTKKHLNTLTSNVTKWKTSRQIIFVFSKPSILYGTLMTPSDVKGLMLWCDSPEN